MRERPVEWNTKLEELILQKSYENLDAVELTFVQSHINETEYEEYRMVLLKSKQSFARNQTQPKAAVQQNLAAAMALRSKAQQPISTAINQAVSYRIPAWQAMIGAAAMLLCFFFFGPQKIMEVLQEPSIVYRTDTIYKKQPAVLVRDTIYEKDTRPKKQKKFSRASISIEEDTIKALNASPKDIFVEESPKIYRKQQPDTPIKNIDYTVSQQGRSAKKDKALMDLLERVY